MQLEAKGKCFVDAFFSRSCTVLNAMNTSLESWPKITDDLRNYSVLLLYPDPQSLKPSAPGARSSLYHVYSCYDSYELSFEISNTLELRS